MPTRPLAARARAPRGPGGPGPRARPGRASGRPPAGWPGLGGGRSGPATRAPAPTGRPPPGAVGVELREAEGVVPVRLALGVLVLPLVAGGVGYRAPDPQSRARL